MSKSVKNINKYNNRLVKHKIQEKKYVNKMNKSVQVKLRF